MASPWETVKECRATKLAKADRRKTLCTTVTKAMGKISSEFRKSKRAVRFSVLEAARASLKTLRGSFSKKKLKRSKAENRRRSQPANLHTGWHRNVSCPERLLKRLRGERGTERKGKS